MKQIWKKALVLLGIFMAAVVIYFIWNQKGEENTNQVFSTMESPQIPLVYVQSLGREINLMHGYKQNMEEKAARDSLTILPEDRQLTVGVRENISEITGIRYEVRSLDWEHLVERTTLESWETSEDRIQARLPIQNLLERDTEYILCLILTDQKGADLYYYTRILWTDEAAAKQMVDFAVDFSNKTFDYNQAAELVTYLESSSTEDNSSLGHVTIRSSFSQLTWNNLNVAPAGEIQVTLKEIDGIMGNVQLDYMVQRETDRETELYQVRENFTMRQGASRLYLMDYTRDMAQIFSGNKELFSGKRIMLGITGEEELSIKKSDNGRYIAFVTGGELWRFDQEEERAVKIFTFRGQSETDLRCSFDRHDIKIIQVEDTGNVDFLVYGYMNRGTHEGDVGAAYYRFTDGSGSIQEDTIEEKFFIPVQASFEEIKMDVNQLSYLGDNDLFYIMMEKAVYGIDLNSNEYMVVADNLCRGGYAVSKDGSHFAWQEGADIYKAAMIHVMDLKTGVMQEVQAQSEDAVRVLGFVGNDFMYGKAKQEDAWILRGRTIDLPMYAIEIVNDNMESETRYEKPGYYIADVTVEESRIHLNRLVKTGESDYETDGDDIIVCNVEISSGELEGIGWYASEERRKLYFVQTDVEIGRRKQIQVSAPRKLIHDAAGLLELKSGDNSRTMEFYAYGNGRLLGISDSFSQMTALAFDKMGFVTDHKQRIVWNRVDRDNTANIRSPENTARRLTRRLEEGGNKEYENDILIFDAQGCTLHQMLYFVGKGCPVAAYTDGGQYILITGYDQYNITVYQPWDGSTYKLGLADGEDYFNRYKNDFVCGIFLD
ncbi:MAG: hypothetical protein Q4C69_03715 [Lachnoclostridium edouardi]|uniref:hypothetical protein n=1 Tax=Lachnoclostridium edouardi TaxID=1926283 RepID=UPI0026DC37D6|nr:hypothetical protein [Lachnoclostridium edouardi]MDO4277917.1 hypothetical protein [Lachnoclostridium edouardi]